MIRLPAAMGIFFLASLSSPASAWALGHAPPSSTDEYNAYRWNRSNHEAGTADLDRGDWYEWWYYKAVDPVTHEAFLFTYGVVNPWDLGQSNAASKSFVSFGHLDSQAFVEQNFSPAEFTASYDAPGVRIGGNAASDRRITGAIRSNSGRNVSWDLSLESDWSYNAMGWAMYVDWISSIYWYPAQASARMNGWIEIDGRRTKLENAPAYQDRNWGRTFPKWWAWLVSNHFENSPGTVLASGGGRPGVLGGIELLDAFTIGFKHEGHEYFFRATEGHSIRMDVRFGHWEVEGLNFSGERIVITAHAPRENFVILPFMTPTGQTFYDYEALLGDLRVQLFKGEELVADVLTKEGGIEYGSFEQYGLDALFAGDISLR